jgi:hypothetical protein
MVSKYLVVISLTLWKYNNSSCIFEFVIYLLFYFACRYLDNLNINGTLEITNMQTIGQSSLIKNYNYQGLRILSLRNNDITNVIYNKSLLEGGIIV